MNIGRKAYVRIWQHAQIVLVTGPRMRRPQLHGCRVDPVDAPLVVLEVVAANGTSMDGNRLATIEKILRAAS